MNKYKALIDILNETITKLEKEWEYAYGAQVASTNQDDKKYYGEIKSKVSELEELLEIKVSEME